jgi:hypothetical protein
MSDQDICVVNYFDPVGLVQSEIVKRRVDCSQHAQAILDALVEADQIKSFTRLVAYSTLNVPYSLLREDDCDGVRLGSFEQPQMTAKNLGPFTLQYQTGLRYVLNVWNDTTNTKYVYIAYEYSDGEPPDGRLVRLNPQEKTIVPVNKLMLRPTRASLIRCRTF